MRKPSFSVMLTQEASSVGENTSVTEDASCVSMTEMPLSSVNPKAQTALVYEKGRTQPGATFFIYKAFQYLFSKPSFNQKYLNFYHYPDNDLSLFQLYFSLFSFYLFYFLNIAFS